MYVPIRREFLHTVLNTGVSVHDIFFTLDQGTGENYYLMAKDVLNEYFNSLQMALFLQNESTDKRDCGTVRYEIEGESLNFEFGDAAAVHEWGNSQLGDQQEFCHTIFAASLLGKGQP